MPGLSDFWKIKTPSRSTVKGETEKSYKPDVSEEAGWGCPQGAVVRPMAQLTWTRVYKETWQRPWCPGWFLQAKEGVARTGKGEEHVQRQRATGNSVFWGLQVAYVARMWGVEDWTGTKVAKHEGFCVAPCGVWILFSEWREIMKGCWISGWSMLQKLPLAAVIMEVDQKASSRRPARIMRAWMSQDAGAKRTEGVVDHS